MRTRRQPTYFCDYDHKNRCDVSLQIGEYYVRLFAAMSQFGVLTNRKRAVIALIHSVVFLGIAAHGFVSRKPGIWHGSRATGDLILIAIYFVVASILIWLVTISRGAVERIYFALCATSATSGLVRTVFGDRAVPAAQYLRVLMLSSAVAIGFVIVRNCSQSLVNTFPSQEHQD